MSLRSARLVTLNAATHLKLRREPCCNVLGLSCATLLGGELRLQPVDLRAVQKLVSDQGLSLRSTQSVVSLRCRWHATTARAVRSSAICACSAASCLSRAASLPEKSTKAGGARFSAATGFAARARGASLSSGFGTRGPPLLSAPFMASSKRILTPRT